MIDILIPVRKRPDNAKKVVESIMQTISITDFSIIFICTEGDESQIEACKQTGARILITEGGRAEYPRKMNLAFQATDRRYVLLAADDLDFQPKWDYEALWLAEETKLSVIGTNDCANPAVMRGDFSTHPLVRRIYVEERGASLDGPGVLCHEGYDHNFTDVEISKLAMARHEWAFAENSHICHLHHSVTGSEPDDTYRKGFRQFARDRKRYAERYRSFK